MKAVSRFEYNLLRILHCFLGRLPLEQVRLLVLNRFDKERPPCLSRAAVELVEEALAKGCVSALGRVGGWRRERFLRNDKPKLGRLWERTPPKELGLTFGSWTLDFLMWITTVKPLDPKAIWQPPLEEPRVGDLLLLTFAYAAMRMTEVGPVLRQLAPFSRNGLCRLMFPRDFVGRDEPPVPDFAPWTSGPGSGILEAYQIDLAITWLGVEMMKADVADWQEMRRLGRGQEQVLEAFLTALERASRPDLARFLLRVLSGLLVENVHPRFWIGGLQTVGPRMADRTETHQGALAVVRQMERFRRWQREARLDGAFDENFPRSQLWLADWEQYEGEALHRRAQELIRQLDPLRQ